MRTFRIQLGLVVLATVHGTGLAAAEPCRTQSFDQTRYIVCSFDPGKDDLRLFWLGSDGQPLRTFAALEQQLAKEGRRLAFAMNGGMYETDYSPVGLHIENGRQLSKANTKTVTGRPSQIPNFYKKPNGVFYFGEGGAGVLETGQFLSRQPGTRFATQSGPMLVVDGAIHPAFLVKSRDRKSRNGVGIGQDGQVHFVITRGPVSFYDFARFFRDGLGSRNALFLDGGSAPGIYAPGLRRNDRPSHGGYGPIIAVVQ